MTELTLLAFCAGVNGDGSQHFIGLAALNLQVAENEGRYATYAYRLVDYPLVVDALELRRVVCSRQRRFRIESRRHRQ